MKASHKPASKPPRKSSCAWGWTIFGMCAVIGFPFPTAAPTARAAAPDLNRLLQGTIADSTARYLGGLPVESASPLGPISQEPSARNHASALDEAFQRFEAERIAKLRLWAPVALGDLFHSRAPLFYMFSGPDFLYAAHLFPAASTMVLCGLEPVGRLPDLAGMDPASRHNGLSQLRSSLQAILAFSFFKTKDMKTDLRGHSFEGTAPVLLCFLARTGKRVIEARLALLDPEGNLFDFVPEHANDTRRYVHGVRITYRDAVPSTAVGAADQTLYYFSADISDSGIARHPGLLKLCAKIGRGNAFVKSASYLMHESYFSRVRTFLLENSDNLLQDDSGIPLKFLTEAGWAIRLFGSYPGPIELFKEKYQPDLAELYRRTVPAPLDFGIGYRHRPGTSTLILATRVAARPLAVPEAGLPRLPPLPAIPGEVDASPSGIDRLEFGQQSQGILQMSR